MRMREIGKYTLAASRSGEEMATIPEDLQNLCDFPQYDATFQDHPQFRRSLEAWADKTKNLGNGLSALADSFDKFHETGMEHYKAASSVISSLQRVAGVCRNDSANTISSHIEQFVDSLNKIWCYYEAFLGQTQMLNANPIRELANNFLGLTTLHQQVLEYRREQLKAAEKLCACRHSSKLTDKMLLPALAEACYSSQKTYQLVLSKFVISLRQAHTIDMTKERNVNPQSMSFIRRIVEFFLSKYAYHNYCTEVLKDLEPRVNEVFAQTKTWKAHHEREMKLWDKLHVAVKKNVLAQYQHKVGFCPDAAETTPTWSGMAMSPLYAGRQMMRRMFPSQSKDIKAGSSVPSGEGDWEHLGGEEGQRRATFTNSRDGGSADSSPVFPRRETVGEDVLTESERMKREWRRKVLRSSSNPDLLSDTQTSSSNGRIHSNRGESPSSTSSSGETPPPSGMVVMFSEDTTEAAAEAMEEFLGRPSGHASHFRPLAAVLGGIRGKKKKAKKKKSRTASTPDDPATESPLVTRSQRERGDSPLRDSAHSSPRSKQKKKRSWLLHSKSHDGSAEVVGESSDVPDTREELRGSSENHCETEDKGRRKKKPQTSLEEPHLQQRLQISSPLTRDWSGSELRNEELQSLVSPPPASWSMTGYLWLRLHTDNRYEWTHIWCVVDKENGEVKVQREEDHAPWCLENLMLCSTKLCTPDFIDRNYCFRVISPTSEHLFQALSSQDQEAWVRTLQNCTAQAIKSSSGRQLSAVRMERTGGSETEAETVSDAMSIILAIPGNLTCADCSSSAVEWASVNLGLVLCIQCSGVHRGLGVHVSKYKVLSLCLVLQFMVRQGNKKANCYYEATLGTGAHASVRKPTTLSTKAERSEFIQQKYVALAFTPPLTERTSSF
ncbi:Arf-GAP with coiled-coil, ANK repeat and PH domain-containing protein 2 [Geodia barretti]|uniref:Arf-GAP with coiled-coil, ANK repeat and PH domain-containing protein 2 n=1 Tax=Geodia barretti TaxID=519541 RepID=A0AA35WRT5_GEOBA|nr:Arf-GAP with coiled-coil, ANK repeat and PH domain-containing protein 2 [Geodia barretti]